MSLSVFAQPGLLVALEGVGARIKRGMLLSDTNVTATSVTSLVFTWASVVSGKTGNAVLTWSVEKNTFSVDTGRYVYTGCGKAPTLSFFVSLLTVLCLIRR